MSDVELRLVGEDAWQRWRVIRLRALRESPAAFGSTYAREAGFTETDWRARLGGDGPTVLACHEGEPVGIGAGFRDRRCHLDVALGNDAARGLYEAYGFVATGEVEPLREGSAQLLERMVLPGMSDH